MIEWMAFSASITALAFVIASHIIRKRVHDDTFERQREASLRRTLRSLGWSEPEIDWIVEKQGW